jgi:hypothetical protein
LEGSAVTVLIAKAPIPQTAAIFMCAHANLSASSPESKLIPARLNICGSLEELSGAA